MNPLSLFLLVAGLISCNPILKDLTSDRYEVDQIMKIEWTPEAGPDADVLLTIDVVNDRPEVLLDPFVIIDGVSAGDSKYAWTIPRYLISSNDYHLRIYNQGQAPPHDISDSGYGKSFNLVNPHPFRQSTLNLIEPTGSSDGKNLESSCLLGEQCWIVWDYPPWAESAMPKTIDIKLYSGDHMVLFIAQGISVTAKNQVWQVPSVITSEPVHVVISASGKKVDVVKPGVSIYLASSGYPFVLETRSDREKRQLFESGDHEQNININPVPIQSSSTNTTSTITSYFEDIPRPTYAPKPKPPQNNKDSKSSASSQAKQSLSISVLVSSLIMILMIQ